MKVLVTKAVEEGVAPTPEPQILKKKITIYGHQAILACDGLCHKAWGLDGRQTLQLSEELDDFVYVSDSELGEAPGPGLTATISEGGDVKPCAGILTDGQLMNKWCSRQCERVSLFDSDESIKLKDMLDPIPNYAWQRSDVSSRSNTTNNFGASAAHVLVKINR